MFKPQGNNDSCQRSHGLRFEPGTAATRAVFKPQGNNDSCQRSHVLRFEPGATATRAVFKPQGRVRERETPSSDKVIEIEAAEFQESFKCLSY